MQLATHVGIGRTSAGIDARHAAVAHRRENHGDHGDQDGCDYVSLASVAKNTVSWHGRSRLNNNNAVED
jgi:hypothetical protein